ncbi:MAG: putative DNA binding domain-containing protein, partial [Candidatus Omnitrophica bacterium]|nr:putative DNA binding domain-containing protein [Candidatus Omnitrophota bacterium]
MNKYKVIDSILQEGEGYKVEFKESFNKSLSKEIVAFANSEGGRIFLGVSDEGKIKGIKITNKLKSQIQDIARNCEPPINLNMTSTGNILIIEVPDGKYKPYQCKEGFFIRVGATTQKMKRDEILKFIIAESIVHFDKEINYRFDIKRDFDKEKFKQFLKKAGISLSERNYRIILENLGVAVRKKGKFFLNNAGVLMFAKNVAKFFRQSFVTCVLYKGNDKVKILDRKDYKGDLLYNYNQALIFLKNYLRLEYVIEGAGPRKEILEIPEEALREALLNALIHREYYDERVGIFVEIYDNRVEIVNKGKLLFDKKYLGKLSVPRNPIIFDLFHRLGLIEKVGSGINRIKSVCKRNQIKVKFDTGEFFITVFHRKILEDETTQKTTQK